MSKRSGLICLGGVVAMALVLYAGVMAYPNAHHAGPTASQSEADQIERGRYLVKVSGCNHCHTPGYEESGGTVPEERWLIGDTLGWRGPWGTTYAINLRLLLSNLSEDHWMSLARTQSRPPMPWFALRDMTDEDLRAIYRFIRQLGPAGELAPAFVPPNQEPRQPYVLFPTPSQ